jgi:hypothetical protein
MCLSLFKFLDLTVGCPKLFYVIKNDNKRIQLGCEKDIVVKTYVCFFQLLGDAL